MSDTLDVFASVNVARYRYTSVNVTAPLSSGPTRNIDTADSRSGGAELRVISSALSGHKLIAGAEYVRDNRRQMANYDVDPYKLYFDRDHPKHQAAVYLQDEMRLGPRVILNTGVRRDADSEGGATTNPRVALLYKTARQVTLKALYGTARSTIARTRRCARNTSARLNWSPNTSRPTASAPPRRPSSTACATCWHWRTTQAPATCTSRTSTQPAPPASNWRRNGCARTAAP
jgi:outer membrane receptor protein involved in Fe transport